MILCLWFFYYVIFNLERKHYDDSLTLWVLVPLTSSLLDMMQWSIFAIKNLCEDNLTNQQYISRLEHQGLSPSNDDFLKNNNIKARLENGKIKLSNVDTSWCCEWLVYWAIFVSFLSQYALGSPTRRVLQTLTNFYNLFFQVNIKNLEEGKKNRPKVNKSHQSLFSFFLVIA